MDAVLASEEKGNCSNFITEHSSSSLVMSTLFNLSFSLVVSLKPEQALPLPARFVAALTKDNHAALVKLKLLSTLFNLWSPVQRYPIFVAILRYSISSGNAAALDGQFEMIDTWTRDWKLTPAQHSELLLLAAQCAQASNHPAEHSRFLMQYFKSLQPPLASNEERAAAKPLAVAAVRSAISSASSAECDALLGLEVVKQLKSDANHASSVALLSILAHDTVDTFEKFSQEHKEVFASLGILCLFHRLR